MKTDRILQAALALMFSAFTVALYLSLHDHVVKAGDKAPSFSVTTENGKTITARDFGGKLLLLNFWASWCPPCVEETPSLEQLSRDLSSKGLVVLGVSIDKDRKAYEDFIKRYNLSFPTANDPNETVSFRFGTIQWPESYLIDRNGRVVEKFIGAENWSADQMVQDVEHWLRL